MDRADADDGGAHRHQTRRSRRSAPAGRMPRSCRETRSRSRRDHHDQQVADHDHAISASTTSMMIVSSRSPLDAGVADALTSVSSAALAESRLDQVPQLDPEVPDIRPPAPTISPRYSGSCSQPAHEDRGSAAARSLAAGGAAIGACSCGPTCEPGLMNGPGAAGRSGSVAFGRTAQAESLSWRCRRGALRVGTLDRRRRLASRAAPSSDARAGS